jgi:hypothetical protein
VVHADLDPATTSTVHGDMERPTPVRKSHTSTVDLLI